MDLKYVFEPKSIAIIGASRQLNKIGNVITKNFADGGFEGDVYPVNPNADEIHGFKCYKSVLDIPKPVESAVIAIKADLVPESLEECGKKGVKGAVVITGGFGEVGNYALEQKVIDIALKYDIAMIGPNCMGILNSLGRNDSIFLPTYKLERPHIGEISYISQSGAVGGCIVDLAARAGIGISKFASYGNAAVVDEADLIEYLGRDRKTKVIAVYLEGIKHGKKFIKIAKKVSKRKPIIVLKAGKSVKGAQAAASHTASLAGSIDVYRAAFKQAGVIEADTLDDLFDFSKIFEQNLSHGNRVAVITNGGGSGVLAADAIDESGLELATFTKKTQRTLRKNLPSYANVRNPLDIIGDADSERYKMALDFVSKDRNVDFLLIIVLFQTAAVDSRVCNEIIMAKEIVGKPMAVVATGGEYTEFHKRILDMHNVPTYTSPSGAVRAIESFMEYSLRRLGGKKRKEELAKLKHFHTV